MLRHGTCGRIEPYEVRLRVSVKGHDGNEVNDRSDFTLACRVTEYANLIDASAISGLRGRDETICCIGRSRMPSRTDNNPIRKSRSGFGKPRALPRCSHIRPRTAPVTIISRDFSSKL